MPEVLSHPLERLGRRKRYVALLACAALAGLATGVPYGATPEPYAKFGPLSNGVIHSTSAYAYRNWDEACNGASAPTVRLHYNDGEGSWNGRLTTTSSSCPHKPISTGLDRTD